MREEEEGDEGSYSSLTLASPFPVPPPSPVLLPCLQKKRGREREKKSGGKGVGETGNYAEEGERRGGGRVADPSAPLRRLSRRRQSSLGGRGGGGRSFFFAVESRDGSRGSTSKYKSSRTITTIHRKKAILSMPLVSEASQVERDLAKDSWSFRLDNKQARIEKTAPKIACEGKDVVCMSVNFPLM